MIKIVSLAAAVALLAPAAHAQVVINVENIDTPAGAARFERDVRKAASNLCATVRGVQKVTCKQGVREEALERLPAPQRLAYLQSQSNRETEYASNLSNQG